MGLQQLSVEPLNTTVTSVGQPPASGRSSLLASPGGWTARDVSLPFDVKGGKLTVRGLDPNGDTAPLNLDPDTKFGSMQTVFDGQRPLLIFTSNGVPQLVEGLLKWLAAPGRWPGLDGRTVISVPNGDPVIVPNPPVAPSVDGAGGASEAEGGHGLFWMAAGGVTLMAALLGVRILLRAHRT